MLLFSTKEGVPKPVSGLDGGTDGLDELLGGDASGEASRDTG